MRTYIDHLGNETRYDNHSELTWRVSIYVIAKREDLILLVEPAWAKRWELPGGAVEPALQETLVEGAIRECWEETGYHFLPDSMEPHLASESFFYLRSRNRYCHSLSFTIEGTTAPDPDPTWQPNPAEVSTVAWVPLHSLSPNTVHTPHWNALQRLGFVLALPD